MARRLLSILAIAAMLVAFLPGVVDAGSANQLLCCNGVMCPFHQLAAANCDTAHSRDGTLQRCPDHGARVMGAPFFVRVARFAVSAPSLLESAECLAFLPTITVEPDVPYPPPRARPS